MVGIDNIDTDYLKKTLNLYEEKSKTLTRTLAILLGVAIFFLFIIFIPYVSILEEEQSISNKKENVQNISKIFRSIQNETNKLNSTLHIKQHDVDKFLIYIISNYTENVDKCHNKKNAVRLIQINNNEISTVKKSIKHNSFWNLDVCNKLGITKEPNFTTTLHFYLNDLNNNEKKSKAYIFYNGMNKSKQPLVSSELNRESIDMLEYYNSTWHVGSPFWLQHNAKNKINSLFNEYNDSLLKINQKIILIHKITDNSLIEKSKISKIVNNLNNSLINLDGNLTKLKDNYYKIIPIAVQKEFNIPFKEAFSNPSQETLLKNATSFNLLITQELEKMRPIFTDINNAINLQLKEYVLISNSLDSNLKLLKDKENETSNRLKEIEFPFGKIPVSINQSISFFPIGLGIGFLICSILLADTIKLRKAYYNEITKDNTHNEKKERGKKISIMAPLWIDPTTRKTYQIIKFIIILMPLVFFGISIYYISHSWDLIINNKELDNIFIGNNISNMVIYIVSYIISIGFFIYGCGRIIMEIRNYPK